LAGAGDVLDVVPAGLERDVVSVPGIGRGRPGELPVLAGDRDTVAPLRVLADEVRDRERPLLYGGTRDQIRFVRELRCEQVGTANHGRFEDDGPERAAVHVQDLV